MTSGPARPFISVKFNPVGRTQSFLLPELALDPPAGDPDVPPGALPPASLPSQPPLAPGDAVVVQTAEGPAVGVVKRGIPQLAERRRPAPDAPATVLRRAPRDDIVARLKHQQREQEAHRICLLKIRERGLGMKLARVEQAFDGSKLIFYFTADGRVDFRELVRELASEFRTRIEMRQIGVRDEAKMYGGYGTCGRPLCCTTFLQTFEPVSIKMAKQQELSLNPSKLSGLCGRLKCCLRYELPNAKGVQHGGCGSEGGCDNPSGCGSGGGCGSESCGSGGCGSCSH
jgi:cell fate regulator YaaT (PSP1 superfamily)